MNRTRNTAALRAIVEIRAFEAVLAVGKAYLLPSPGLGLKCCLNLSGTPFQLSASAGAWPLRVMLGHLAA